MSELLYGLFYLGVLALVVVCLAYLFSTRDQSRASRAGGGESAPRVIVRIILGLLLYPFKINSYRRSVKNARALICSLGESPLLAQEAEQDAEIYRRHFPTVRMLKAGKLTDLLSVLRSEEFNILHLVNAFAEDGGLVESQATRADITPLFQLCRTKKLVFVYLGGEILENNRTAVFESIGAARVGHDFPLVIMMDRGAQFRLFFSRLLHEITNGEVLATAWLKLRPQDTGPGVPQPEVDPGPKAVLLL